MPRRRGRLRRPARRVRRAGPRALRHSAWSATTTSRCSGELDISSFSPAAAAAVRWTSENGDPETLEFLRGAQPVGGARGRRRSTTPRRATRSGSTCSRPTRQPSASSSRPSGSAWSATRTSPSTSSAPAAKARARPGRRAAPRLPPATRSTSAEGSWLLNPGSVGQPRDGDPRAAWLELDTEAWRRSSAGSTTTSSGRPSAILDSRPPRAPRRAPLLRPMTPL